MKANAFNIKILQSVKRVKKVAFYIMSSILIFGLTTGCLGSEVMTPQSTRGVDDESISEIANTKDETERPSMEINQKNYSRDISDDYISVYVGSTDGGVILANRENFIRYKDSSNAYTREASNFEDSPVFMEDDKYDEFLELLDHQKLHIPYSELFNVEHLLARETDHKAEHHGTFNFVNGRVDENELYRVVKYNNDHYNYSITFTDSELSKICHTVAKNLNYALSTNSYIDKDALKCVLSNLKIFKENDVTNARITDDLVLAISPASIANLQNTVGDSVDAFDLTIGHETGHLPQMPCNDEFDHSNSTKIGFNQKWDDEPVNSLFWNWYYEASAESIMMKANNSNGLVYPTQIGYLKYLNMVLSLKSEFKGNTLENVSVSRNRDDFFVLFDALDTQAKVEIAEIMYAIEIIQNENEDFEKAYLAHTGSNQPFLFQEDWVAIKRDVKSGLAVYLSLMFYKNLAQSVKDGKMTLKDVYHVISVFEAEIESHNTYDSLNRFEANRPFMKSYTDVQDAFFMSILTDYTYDEIVAGFDNYSYSDGATLAGLGPEAKNFFESRREELHESTTSNIRTFYDVLSTQMR